MMLTKTARMSRRMKIVSAVIGVLLAGVGAYAATNWVVGLNAGSSGEGQSATISNLTVTAVASPAATNLLYPGGTGDVVVRSATRTRTRSRSRRYSCRRMRPTRPAIRRAP